MKSKRFSLILLLTLFLIAITVWSGQAQTLGPLLILHGPPDTTSAPPALRAHVSVIDKNTDQVITGLDASNFELKQTGVPVEGVTVQETSAGLAVVVVVDRGGISRPRDPRLKEATDLVRELIDRLERNGTPADDMLAIVGVGEGDTLYPEENFTYNPVDINRVLNALIEMESESLRGTTPLYNGLDEALRLLTENPDATIRDILTRRRKLILIFSDGIDRNYSDQAKEGDIIRKANEADVSIYAIGMAQPNQNLYQDAGKNLTRLSNQTYGSYQLHNDDETHQQVLDLFERIVTQRQQYLLSFDLDQPKGNYSLSVLVDTSIGSAERKTTFDSILEPPQLLLTAPSGDVHVTVPYSSALKSFVTREITLSAQVVPVDGVSRVPPEVRYFANGEIIGKSTDAPDFGFSWDLTDLVELTDREQNKNYTLSAEATDPYLNSKMSTENPATVKVTWASTPPPTTVEQVKQEVSTNWWQLALIILLSVGVIVLFVLLLKTRGEVGRRAIKRTTGFLKGVTRQLPSLSQRAPGKLVVTKGPSVGKEFPLIGSVVKVGRDPQFCDFALHDEYVSNPHFSVFIEDNKFYIQDEGSRNQTKLNGTPLEPKQRQPLTPEAVIQAGYVQLEFKHLKRDTTRDMR